MKKASELSDAQVIHRKGELRSNIAASLDALSQCLSQQSRLGMNLKRQKTLMTVLPTEIMRLNAFKSNLLTDCLHLQSNIVLLQAQGYTSTGEYVSQQPFAEINLIPFQLTPMYTPVAVDTSHLGPQNIERPSVTPDDTIEALEAALLEIERFQYIANYDNQNLLNAITAFSAGVSNKVVMIRKLQKDVVEPLVVQRENLIKDYQTRMSAYEQHRQSHQKNCATSYPELTHYETHNGSSQPSPSTPPMNDSKTLTRDMSDMDLSFMHPF